MNLQWLKRNLVVIIFAVIFAVMLGVIIWLERKASARKESIEADLTQEQSHLDQLRKLPLYPSQKNIEILKQDHIKLSSAYNAMTNQAARERLQIPPLKREIDFNSRLQTALKALDKEASKRDIRTPENFAFGFSRYVAAFPCRNPPLKSDECQKLLVVLAKQLEMVERLTMLAMTSGIEEISAIRRTEVEAGSASADSLSTSILRDQKGLYEIMPFEFQFTCNTQALQDYLNALSGSGLLLTVKSLKVNSEVQTSSLTVGTATPEPASPTASSTGPTVERRRIQVTLRVDLIEFLVAEAKSGK